MTTTAVAEMCRFGRVAVGAAVPPARVGAAVVGASVAAQIVVGAGRAASASVGQIVVEIG